MDFKSGHWGSNPASTKRLECYDSAAKEVTTLDRKEADPPQTEWVIKDEKSPIDDSPRVFAQLMASDGQGTLMLRCHERKTDAVYMPKAFAYLGNDQIRVTYRIDQAKPIDTHWAPSTRGTGAFAAAAIPFIRALPDNGKLFIRVRDYRGQPYESVFDLGQVSEARNRLASACQWGVTGTVPRQGPAAVAAPAATQPAAAAPKTPPKAPVTIRPQ